MKIYVKFILILVGFFFLSCKSDQDLSHPNIIVIFTDDQGYQDMGVYGSPKINTPNLDKMAQKGLQLTNFYVSMSVCSASRASLLTGQYSFGNGVGGVYFPDHKGMDSANVIIPEVIKKAGYRTAAIGKWHLGDLPGSLPVDQGFDEYYGIPYSNDMYIGFSQRFSPSVKFNYGYSLAKAKADQDSVKKYQRDRQKLSELGLRDLVPIMSGNEIVEYPADQASLTRRYFDRARQFIDENQENPFFLYITPAMPHVPLYASEQFEGTSKRGLYGDVIEEIDHYTGELLQYLKAQGLAENTLVIFCSDNGPWLGKGDAAGSAAPLRDGKFSRYEGGVRVPCLMWWPGTIPEGSVSDQVTSTLDFFPTISILTNSNTNNLNFHGQDLSRFLSNPAETTLNHPLLYMDQQTIAGIRKGPWKYLRYSGKRNEAKDTPAELYNLDEDISESQNLLNQFPEKVNEMEALIRSWESK